MSPDSLVQQKEISLFWEMGFLIRPDLTVWQWICWSWSMDLQFSIRKRGGSRLWEKRVSDVDVLVEIIILLLRIKEDCKMGS